MSTNTSYMRLAERGELDQQRDERRSKGRMPMAGLGCSFGTVIDLSPSGVCIHRHNLRGRGKIGNHVNLIFKCEGEKVVIKARIARVMPDGFMKKRYGLMFIDLTPSQQAKLMEFAKTCWPKLTMADRNML